MKKNNKSTPFLMILVLSFVATQLSLKAFGVNITPSIATLVHSWGKVAGVIGCVYHPGLIAELDTLSNHFLCSDGKVPRVSENSNPELACTQDKNFEFELPPPIDVNDPSVTLEEPVQGSCLKVISRSSLKKEILDIEKVGVEVLQIAADSDEESTEVETKPDANGESIRSIAVGLVTDDSEAETKALAPQFEDKIFVSQEEAPVTPKSEKQKKPCEGLEKLRKLDETRRLLDEFQGEQELQFVNQTQAPFEIQASQAKRYLEKAKRVRVIIKMNPLVLLRPAKTDSFNFMTVAEESEF